VEFKAYKQLKKLQLVQYLNMPETLATSSKVFVDGSIQKADKQQLKNHNHFYYFLLKETSLVTIDNG